MPTPNVAGDWIELDEEGVPFEEPDSQLVGVLLYIPNIIRPNISIAPRW